MTIVPTQVRIDEVSVAVEVPQYKNEVFEAMEEAKKISRDSNTKRYSNFSEVLENLD